MVSAKDGDLIMAETYDPFAFMRAGTPGYTRLGSQFMPAYQARTSFSPGIEMFQPEMLPAPLPPDKGQQTVTFNEFGIPVQTRIPEELLLESSRQMPGGLPTPGVSGGQIPQRAVAPAVDYSKFPLPALPARPQLAPMPTRDLPMERQRTSRASLRAGLIGALLGGGVGAIAGMTGAQQGAQQAFDQDYAQRVAESQDQQRRALQEYQFGTAEYNQRLAALNAMIGREEAQRAAGQQFLDVDYANQLAAYNRQKEVERQQKEREENRIKALREGLATAIKAGVMPEDIAQFLKSYEEGTIPTEAIRKAPTASQINASMAQTARSRDAIIKTYGLDPKQYSTKARQHNAAVRANENIPDDQKGLYTLPEEAFTTQAKANLAMAERKFEEDVRQFGIETAMNRLKAARDQEQREWDRVFKRDQEAFKRANEAVKNKIRAKEAEGKGKGAKVKAVSSGEVNAAVSIFNRMAKNLEADQKELSSPVTQTRPERVKVLEARVDALKKSLLEYSKDPETNKYVRFTIDPEGGVYFAAPSLYIRPQDRVSPSAPTGQTKQSGNAINIGGYDVRVVK